MAVASVNLTKFNYWFLFWVPRVFSRIAVVPFNRIDKEQSLENSLNLQMELKPLLETVVRSIGIILRLGESFATMRTDPTFQEVLAMTDSLSGIDLRAKFNYVLLTFSTGKVGHVLNLHTCTFNSTKIGFHIFFSQETNPRFTFNIYYN